MKKRGLEEKNNQLSITNHTLDVVLSDLKNLKSEIKEVEKTHDCFKTIVKGFKTKVKA